MGRVTAPALDMAIMREQRKAGVFRELAEGQKESKPSNRTLQLGILPWPSWGI
jgi:hypothetical protein